MILWHFKFYLYLLLPDIDSCTRSLLFDFQRGFCWSDIYISYSDISANCIMDIIVYQDPVFIYFLMVNVRLFGTLQTNCKKLWWQFKNKTVTIWIKILTMISCDILKSFLSLYCHECVLVCVILVLIDNLNLWCLWSI